MERDQASKFINDLLRLMLSRKGSDLFLTAEFPPAIKVDGKLTKVSPQPLTGQHTLQLARAIMNDKQAAEFERTKECNFAISPHGVGRFRVNAFIQQGQVGLVLRTIPSTLPTITSLDLPVVLREVVQHKRGLVIVVGATGSGKSTSLAAMIDERNETTYGHIVTIEDPIEFVHPHKNCIVHAARAGPGHRLLGGRAEELAAPGARRHPDGRAARPRDDGACRRLRRDRPPVHGHAARQQRQPGAGPHHQLLPEDRRQQLLMDLSLNLRALVSQRLLPRREGKGRVAAVEILLNSPLVSDLIFKGEITEIKELMKRSRELGMQTFDQALFDLYEAGKVTYEDALRNADSVNDLRLQIKLNSERARSGDLSSGTEHLTIV